jgi:hypothetical protein
MIICNFNFICVAILPEETNPVRVVNANTVLPLSIAFELFQAVAGRNSKIIGRPSSVKHQQLPKGRAAKVRRWDPPALPRFPKLLRLPVCETPDHIANINTRR